MNWKTLRPVLRNKFGENFEFYNDLYKSGTRRIKIRVINAVEVFNYIKSLDPTLDVKLYKTVSYGYKCTRVTIHYR
jgi:hypothetical protein